MIINGKDKKIFNKWRYSMKIGIIVHSRTGHTHFVAQRLQEKLSADGHAVDIQQLRLAGGQDVPGKDSMIKNPPDLNGYDRVIFGAPVHAFSLSKVMEAYLTQVSSLTGKTVACFVTKGLPFGWTGGNRAISEMKEICESKWATVSGTGIVIWNKNRQKQIDDLVEKFSGLLDLDE
jgi:NAD(P)H dehydrogenase (quinone)